MWYMVADQICTQCSNETPIRKKKKTNAATIDGLLAGSDKEKTLKARNSSGRQRVPVRSEVDDALELAQHVIAGFSLLA
jgi:hypothetical protein